MKKAVTKKLMAVLLAAAMTVSVAGCGNSDDSSQEKSSEVTTTSVAASESEQNVEEETEVVFPLEEEMTFELMVKGDATQIEKLETLDYWQDLYEATNVKVDIIVLPQDNTLSTLNAMFAAGQEGDAIASQFISDTDLSTMAASDLLLPLNEYIDNTDIMPNFNERVLAECPQVKGVIASPDGNIYALPRYEALEGQYLESTMWINKAWLDQLGMNLPTTLEELKEVLIAFRDNDMNGNGKNDDEIPYFVMNGNSMSHFEAFLGLYGIPTKDSNLENYIYLEDGKVTFAPATQAYKDALTVLNDWYEEGLIWSECFTATNETYSAKLSGSDAVVGLYNFKTPPATNAEDYVQLAPVAVDGYEAKWYVHPGLLGIKGQFCVTRSCENPEVLMKWIDLFYTFENSVRECYGEEEDGYYEIIDNKVYPLPSTPEMFALKEENPVLEGIIMSMPRAYTISDYEERLGMGVSAQQMQDSYDLYRPYLNDEIWPRPYLSDEVTTRLGELRTDIFNTVSEKKAAWITGVADIDAEWDEYVESLNKMGVSEFVEILQETYDAYVEAQK